MAVAGFVERLLTILHNAVLNKKWLRPALLLAQIKNPYGNGGFFICGSFVYCASDILNCKPALVLVVGALEEMYGITLR